METRPRPFRHTVDSYPQLLFFKDGAPVERETGAEAVRASVTKVLGDAADGDPSATELAFREAYARARCDDVTGAAGKEVEPHMQAIAPALDGCAASEPRGSPGGGAHRRRGSLSTLARRV
jgi:hypothetical protein